jgi:hypothetical protein
MLPVMDQKLASISLVSVQIFKVKQLIPGIRSVREERELEAALPALEADAEQTFARIREGWGYKRKQINLLDSTALSRTIETPDFSYRLSLELDPDDNTHALWRREVLGLRGTTLSHPAFERVFGEIFGKAVLEYEKPIPIADIIDRIEETNDSRWILSYDSKCTSCSIHIAGISGTLFLEGNCITVESPGTRLTSTLSDLLGLSTKGGCVEITAPPGIL